MTRGVPAKVIAASMGLGAFGIAVIAGLAAGNPAQDILLRAILSLIVCHILGLIIGMVAETAVTEQIRDHQIRNPIPAHDDGLAVEVADTPAQSTDSAQPSSSARHQAA